MQVNKVYNIFTVNTPELYEPGSPKDDSNDEEGQQEKHEVEEKEQKMDHDGEESASRDRRVSEEVCQYTNCLLFFSPIYSSVIKRNDLDFCIN